MMATPFTFRGLTPSRPASAPREAVEWRAPCSLPPYCGGGPRKVAPAIRLKTDAEQTAVGEAAEELAIKRKDPAEARPFDCHRMQLAPPLRRPRQGRGLKSRCYAGAVGNMGSMAMAATSERCRKVWP
jgi:hypothetical protein